MQEYLRGKINFKMSHLKKNLNLNLNLNLNRKASRLRTVRFVGLYLKTFPGNASCMTSLSLKKSAPAVLI